AMLISCTGVLSRMGIQEVTDSRASALNGSRTLAQNRRAWLGRIVALQFLLGLEPVLFSRPLPTAFSHPDLVGPLCDLFGTRKKSILADFVLLGIMIGIHRGSRLRFSVTICRNVRHHE